MDHASRGYRLKIDASRRLVLDLLHFSRKAPIHPAEKYFDLREVEVVRRQAAVRISWPVLFIKAYGLVAAEMPELRRSYIDWPRPHFYQHPHSVALLAMSRRYQGVDRVFWARLMHPESTTLVHLQSQLRHYSTAPVEEVFDRQLLLSRFPTWLRRLIWWGRINLGAKHRARRLGTFGLSVLANHGVYNRMHPHFLTASLSYGPTEPDGRTLVTLIGDHRVMDGASAVRALKRLESTLRNELCDELADLQPDQRACA